VWRFLAGAAACFLLMTGAFLFWQGRAAEKSGLPSAPSPRSSGIASYFSGGRGGGDSDLEAPEADPKTREEKRFSRADKNKDGKIERDEILEPRRKAFAKLDTNGDGVLSFNEWAFKTIKKFDGADADRNGWLSPEEYATTAPPPRKKKRCAC
jgi:hypothetical protein